MKLEIRRKSIANRITIICIESFVLVALLIVANHVIDIPSMIFNTAPVPADWVAIVIDLFFILTVGVFTVYWISRLDIGRRQAEELYHTLANSSTVGVYIVQDGKFRLVNPQFQRYMEYTEEELLGKDSLSIVHPGDRGLVRRNAVAMLKRKRLDPYEFRVILKSGRVIWAMETVTSINYGGKRAILGNFMDITGRKQAEEGLKQAAEEWRTTFDSITEQVSIVDRDFRLTRVNRALSVAVKMKPDELIGRRCYEVVHGTAAPVPDCPHSRSLELKQPVTREFFEPNLGIYQEVSTSPVFDDGGEVVASVHIARDVSERKKMQQQLVIADRLASVGELAAGIAHELNNPLTSVVGFSQLLLNGGATDEVKKDLEVVCQEAQRAAYVVKNLLAFAQKHAPVKKPVDINEIIEKVLDVRAYEQRVSNIKVVTHLAPELPGVMADYFQLQQVFINIVINAEYFMIEAHNGGFLTVATESTGGTVRAAFTDDGPGIAEEAMEHLFDPFFTTKELGKGTGLGLSICHGIITEHGGRITADSKPGKGATFVVELSIACTMMIAEETNEKASR
jgi:PAS domain S-box-containing protein